MAACAETLTPVLIEAGGKDALIVDADADVDAAADAAAVGRLHQRRADLHRRRAGLRARAGVRRVPRRAARQGAGRCAPTTAPAPQIGPITMPRQIDVDPPPHRGRARPRRPRGARRRRTRSASGSCSRRSWSTCPRTPLAVQRGDLRPDGDRRQGARHGRGGRAGQRDPLRPRRRRSSPRRAAWRSPSGSASGMTAINGVITFAGDPEPALRRRRRLRLRPHPRRRRAQGVHLRPRRSPGSGSSRCWR